MEMMLVLLIYTASFLYVCSFTPLFSYRYQKKLLISEYALTQSDAIYYKEHEDFEYEDLYSRYSIRFNGRGNVNMAQSINYDSSEDLVIYLGCGRIHEY